jgi:predicted DNA-binding transcriptional regulator AlpA
MLSNVSNTTTASGDRVRSLRETAALLGVSIATLRRMIAAGDGPVVTQLSARRQGIRDSHREMWLDARAKSAATAA